MVSSYPLSGILQLSTMCNFAHTMEKHYQLTDQQFEQQFKNCTLDPSLFTHEAHLRLAWIHIKKYGEEQAIINVCEQIRRFAENAGAHNKYNETVTIAAIKAVHHFMKRSDTNSFTKLIEEFPGLKNNFKVVIGSHYSIDVFKSGEAKEKYMEPDLLPFT